MLSVARAGCTRCQFAIVGSFVEKFILWLLGSNTFCFGELAVVEKSYVQK
jgi:hypothetical protein